MTTHSNRTNNPDVPGGRGPFDRADGPGTDERDPDLPLDQVFETLRNERRRRVLRYLREHDDPVSVGELAEHTAALENETTATQVAWDERKAVYVSLYQFHLPKMDRLDVVEFDQDRGRVSLGPTADQLVPYLDRPTTENRAWLAYSGAAALGGIALLTTHVLGTRAVGLTPTVAATAVYFAGLAAVIAAKAITRRRGDGR